MIEEAPQTGQPGAAAPESGAGPLSLLLFPFAGAWFGLDLEQLRAIEDPPAEEGLAKEYLDGEEPATQEPVGDEPVALHRLLGLSAVEYRQPRVVWLRNGPAAEGGPRLLIEAPEDIVEVDWREIRPLPPLAETFTRPLGVWGVLPQAGRLVLLLDLEKLQPRLSELSCKEKG